MSLTLLLDLDNTLLGNDMDVFIPAYLRALGGYMAEHHDSKNFVGQLLSATQKMINNIDPRHTLKQTFDADFYPSLGIEQSKVISVIDKFYQNIFPGLEKYTVKRPQAVEMVDQAVERGYNIVIATNPLFPATAIHQRLEWAGLPSQQYNFQLVSSYETFHFAKPNPAYYAEILARLGWPEQPVVMVGNDKLSDIQAAEQVGLPTFWVNLAPDTAENTPTRNSGRLEDLIPWIDTQLDEQLLPDYSNPLASRAILRSTPAVLSYTLENIHPGMWNQRPVEGEWSLTEIICHLRDVDMEVNIPRLKKILTESNPFIPAAVTDPWAEERQYNNQDGVQALETFVNIRLEFLQLLERLATGEWGKPFRHAIFGPTPVSEMIKINAAHDRLHIQQVLQTTSIVSSFDKLEQPKP